MPNWPSAYERSAGSAQRDVHADALVVARIVEVDANAHERLVGALLEARLRFDVALVPHVRAMQDVDAAERSLSSVSNCCSSGLVDQDVAVGRRVVVTVADVLAANDPRQLPTRPPKDSVPGTVPWTWLGRTLVQPSGGAVHGCDERPLRDVRRLAASSRLARLRRDLRDELLHVEQLRIRFVADLELHAPAFDAEAVQDATEELPPVQARRDREQAPRRPRLSSPTERLRAARPPASPRAAAGKLELDRLPLVGDVDLELDETATCSRGDGLTTANAPRGTSSAIRATARCASSRPICSASA